VGKETSRKKEEFPEGRKEIGAPFKFQGFWLGINWQGKVNLIRIG